MQKPDEHEKLGIDLNKVKKMRTTIPIISQIQ
jgi:hypothetical protein